MFCIQILLDNKFRTRFFLPKYLFPKITFGSKCLFWKKFVLPYISFFVFRLIFMLQHKYNNKNNTNLMCFETIKIKLALVIFPIYTEPRFWITPWFNFLGGFEAEKLSNYKDLINVAGHPLWPLSKGSYA